MSCGYHNSLEVSAGLKGTMVKELGPLSLELLRISKEDLVLNAGREGVTIAGIGIVDVFGLAKMSELSEAVFVWPVSVGWS